MSPSRFPDPVLTVLVAGAFCMLYGCAHAPLPYLPADPDPVPEEGVVEECSADQACLQVFIVYGRFMCSHTALRVQSGKKAIFWDPAGGYGLEGSKVARRNNDVLDDDAPSLNEYILFRTEIPTRAMEIFEWRIAAVDANRLFQVLGGDRDKLSGEDDFSTKGVGLFCSSYVSGFLERFSNEIVQVRKVFFPHDLARQLYGQRPSRVIVVTIGSPFSIGVLGGERIHVGNSPMVRLSL